MPPPLLDDALRVLRRLATRRAWRGLSAKLLGWTVVFVMLAEVLIFLPSAANFRIVWLRERVQAAELAVLAVDVAEAVGPDFDFMVPDDLARELLASAEVRAVGVIREGRSDPILRGEPPPGPMVHVMLTPPDDMPGRLGRFWSQIYDACETLVAGDDRYLLVTALRERMGAGAAEDDEEYIEVLIAEAPLRAALIAYSQNIFWLSVLISLFTGLAVYLVLSLAFVRPMHRLATAMTRFREAPEDAARVITPSGRGDEIGRAEVELQAMQDEVRLALRQKERLAALGAAIAKINHDLRNVLTSAQLVSDRLAAHPDPTVRGPAERLVRAIDRGVRLAEDVLRYGRAEESPPRTAPTPLRAVLEDAFYDAAASVETPTGLDVCVGDEVMVLADPEHLHRIFLNLMRNAAQAMAAQPDRAAPGMIGVTVRREGGLVVVRVADNGPGVPERARAGLFQAFAASTRKGGSGLGLSIARELARAMGGDVVLAETGETGAAFDVSLRAA